MHSRSFPLFAISIFCAFPPWFGDAFMNAPSGRYGLASLVNSASLYEKISEEEEEKEALGEPSCRSSDMTDRFKYKVNALMGTYDPQTGVDDERQDGNILQAILEFPIRYTFNVVGKTNGDEAIRTKYIDDVKRVILDTSGDNDVKWEVVPRGEKFTKIKCEIEVHSSTMVNKIYEDISNLERTVMKF